MIKWDKIRWIRHDRTKIARCVFTNQAFLHLLIFFPSLRLLTLPEPYVSQLPRPISVTLLRASATILEELLERYGTKGDWVMKRM